MDVDRRREHDVTPTKPSGFTATTHLGQTQTIIHLDLPAARLLSHYRPVRLSFVVTTIAASPTGTGVVLNYVVDSDPSDRGDTGPPFARRPPQYSPDSASTGSRRQ